MAQKKNDEPERICATCGRGPDKDKCMDREVCESGDLWFPKEPECDGDSCTISVNGGPAVPFEKVEVAFAKVKVGQLDLDGNPVPDLDMQGDNHRV